MSRLAAFLYRRRIPLTAVLVIGAVTLSPRAAIRGVDNDISAWFSPNDPLYRDYDRFRAEFGGTQPLIIALRDDAHAAAGLFTRERLEFLNDITGDIERITSVQRVESLGTASVLHAQRATSDDPAQRAESVLAVGPLLDLSRRSAEEIRTLALNDPLLRGDLVSPDGAATALVVTFDEAALDRDRSRILNQIYTTVRSRLPSGVSAYFNGSIEISETYNRVTIENQRRFIPPILVVTLLALYVLFRSMARAAVVMGSIVVSVLWTLGLYSLMGFGFNILTAMLTPLIVVLAISDDVHIIQHYDEECRRGNREQAFTATVAYLFAPLLAASGTTALGLLSLATSDVVAVRQFGIGAAVGVMVDFFSSLVLVPTLLSTLAPAIERGPQSLPRLADLLERAAAFSTRRPRIVLSAAVAVTIAAGIGITHLRVDTNHINFFASNHPLSRSAAVIDSELAGVYSFHVLLEGPPDSMKAPDTVSAIDRLAAAIAALPQVRKTTSMADHVKRTNRELHDGNPAAAVVPADPQLLAQEILLFTLNDAGRRELERVVSSDFSIAQIVVRLPSMSSDRVFETIQTAQRLATEMFAGTRIKATVTGSGRLFSALDHYLVRSQISSFSTAFVSIFAAMFVVFRSVRFGLLALVPNVFPVVAVLGAMGWFNISLNVATVMVAGVALGVVDDDTVHFLTRFRHDIAGGVPVDAAAHHAAASEGRAAFMTALINSAGFAVLMLSEYKPSAWFGGLLALTLVVAFLAEVLILPATITLVAPYLLRDPRTVLLSRPSRSI